jgi:L,D-transpeptidase YcbB
MSTSPKGIAFVLLDSMKKIFLILFCLNLLFSCSNSQPGASQTEKESESEEVKKNVSKRDYGITTANSYSGLFLDSMAMENFMIEKKVPDSLQRRLRSFYNTRNYQFAWFSTDGLTEQARGFWNLHDYVTTYNDDPFMKDKVLQEKMEDLVMAKDVNTTANKATLETELTLTQHFIHYMLTNYEKGYVKRKEMERFVPRKKEDALYLADSLITKKHKDDKYFEDKNKAYNALKEHLIRHYDIAKKGGWPVITTKQKTLKKGFTGPEIAVIKKRLQISGEMPGTDTSQVFNDSLETAINNFQSIHGFTPTGIINEALIKEMNVSAIQRLKQLLMNMDRMRWQAADPIGNIIVVNIPEFVLHVYEGSKKAFDMVVVVGKDGHNTMMFNGDMTQVVFSPYWNVPPSIVKNEILPAMNRRSNYLSSQNMEITSSGGSLPVIRQRPGPGNALGKVKFLFPNSFNIYFHDTPSKSLFSRDKRAFSHGCIRLAEPEKMANYVLRNQPEWTPEKIRDAMNSGTEKFVKLKEPIPVVVTYYTSWVDETGQLNFREDIYGHDQRLASKMFK